MGWGRAGIPSAVPIPSKAGTAGPTSVPAFTLGTHGAFPLPFGKWCPVQNLKLERGLDAAAACPPHGMGLQLSGAKPPWKWSSAQTGALLAGLCTYKYIYICATRWGAARQPCWESCRGAGSRGAGRGWQRAGAGEAVGCCWQGLLQRSCRGCARCEAVPACVWCQSAQPFPGAGAGLGREVNQSHSVVL